MEEERELADLMTATKSCPKCGGNLIQDSTESRIKVNGHTIMIEVLRCDTCGNVYDTDFDTQYDKLGYNRDW